VRMRSSIYACALPIRPVRALKAVLLKYSLKTTNKTSHKNVKS